MKRRAGMCSERMSDRNSRWPSFYPCRRIATGEDGLCNLHRAAKKRVMLNDERREAARDRDAEREKRAEAFCKELRKIGLKSCPHWSGNFKTGYTGKVVIDDPAELLRILNMCGAKEKLRDLATEGR